MTGRSRVAEETIALIGGPPDRRVSTTGMSDANRSRKAMSRTRRNDQ
jgi:hypothetical protein